MKILNLYAGIGGNRKLWGDEHEITAVEFDPQIAAIYRDFFPNDKVIVADAHQYLLDHFAEFEFIWSSPPCQTHTTMNLSNGLDPYKDNSKQISNGGAIPIRYPKMELYQEIILLQTWFKGKWCVENVVGYYQPLIPPQEIAKHYFWANFYIRPISIKTRGHQLNIKDLSKFKGFDLSNYHGINREQTLRNCVEPQTGLHIFNEAFKSPVQNLF